MNQEKTQCNTVVIPQMDEVSVSVTDGYVFIVQKDSANGTEDAICIHPMFADAVCAAIMRAAKEAGEA